MKELLSPSSEYFMQSMMQKTRSNGLPYITQHTKNECHLQRVAQDYIYDVMTEPKRHVALPTASSLDFSRYLKNEDGVDIQKLNNLERLAWSLTASHHQKSLWDAIEQGCLAQWKLNTANTIANQRIHRMKQIASYFHKNKLFKPTEASLIILLAAKFHLKLNHSGVVKISNIKKNNEHLPLPLIGRLAQAIQYHLRQGTQAKKAFVQAYIDIKNSEEDGLDPMIIMGWVEFPQSSRIEDAKKLQLACSKSNWCVGGDIDQAQFYLTRGSFWLYFNDDRPEVAVHMDGQCIKPFGREADQSLNLFYQNIANEFIEQLEFQYILETGNCFEEAENYLITADVLNSLKLNSLSENLLSYVDLDLDTKHFSLNLPDMGDMDDEIHDGLYQLLDINRIIRTNSDHSVSIHANVYIKHNVNLLKNIRSIVGNLFICENFLQFHCLTSVTGSIMVERAKSIQFPNLIRIQGNLDMGQSDNMEYPKLTNVAGYIDARNSHHIHLPALKNIGGTIDMVGSEDIEIPYLKNTHKCIDSYHEN